jgi:hypothetical protein
LERFPKPIDLCFDDVVRSLARWSKQNTNSELVAPIFAYSNAYREVGRLYGAQEWYRNAPGSLAFDFPYRVVPLLYAAEQ